MSIKNKRRIFFAAVFLCVLALEQKPISLQKAAANTNLTSYQTAAETLNENDSLYADGTLTRETDPVAEIKNSVVEIQTGISLSNGKFYPVKNASGFLISNDSEGVYVITANHSVTLTQKEKKRFCKKKKIAADDYSVNTSIRLVVKGDVTTEVSILANSKSRDFCVLNAADVLKERQALKLGSAGDIVVGDTIYALGYPAVSQDSGSLQYTPEEVEIHSGEIQDTAASVKGESYLQHSAIVLPDSSGGPLVTKDGYLVGMNNASIVNENIDVFYSLPVAEIQEILDNYGIFYDSRERDSVYSKLLDTYEECSRLTEAKGYKSETMEVLEAAVQEVTATLSEQHISIDVITGAQKNLTAAKQQLVKKTPKTKIVIVVLGIICGLLLIRLGWLLWWQYKAKREAVAEMSGDSVSGERKGERITASSKEMAAAAISPGKYDAAADNTEKRSSHRSSVSTVLSGDETVILRNYAGSHANDTGGGSAFSNRKKRARMIRERTRQVIILDKVNFIIGKNSDAADYAVSDNRAISRRHASIRWENESCFIYDLDSANGTFVNGKKIDSSGVRLSNHDKIVLADEAFEFIEEQEV